MPSKKHDHIVMPLVVAVLSLSGFAARAAVPASARELGGIRLGMTMEEVKAAAAAHEPPLVLEKPVPAPAPGQPGKTFPAALAARSYAGLQPPDFVQLDITFSTPPLVPRVVQITQVTGSSEARAPSKELLQKTLREKFGVPSAPQFPGWVWASNGAAARGEEAENCLIGHGTWLNHYHAQPEAVLPQIRDNSKTCGLVAVASLRNLRFVSITVTDYAALAEALAKAVEAKGAPAASRPSAARR